MSDSRDQTIPDVSKTLIDLLKANFGSLQNQVVLASPRNAGGSLLTLFLYKVLQNPDLKNEDGQVVPSGDGKGGLVEKRVPLFVDLYYLLTAHATGTPPDLLEAHKALSRAMRVFYDNGILRGSLLKTLDANKGLTADAVLRITLNPITIEDMTRIWSVFPDMPYELSVTYLVTPVPIESGSSLGTAPVVDQTHRQGLLAVPVGAGA